MAMAGKSSPPTCSLSGSVRLNCAGALAGAFDEGRSVQIAVPAAAAPARSAPPIANAIPRRVERYAGPTIGWIGVTRCVARLPRQRLLQFEQRITDVAQPVRGVLLQTPAQQPRHRRRRIRRQSRPIRLSCEDGRQRIGEGRGRERRAAGEHVVQHASERPDIGPAIDLPSARLFRAHVRCGSEDDARGRAVPGQRRRGSARIGGGAHRQRLGKTEVQDLDRAGLSDFDVRWLQIAMDDAAIMRRFDTAGDLKRIAERLTNGEGAGREAARPVSRPIRARACSTRTSPACSRPWTVASGDG